MQAWAVEARKQGVLLHPSLEAAMSELATGSQRGSIESVFVIGGGQVPILWTLEPIFLVPHSACSTLASVFNGNL